MNDLLVQGVKLRLCAGVAIAERLKPFKVKKFIYTDVEPRPELAKMIEAEYGGTISEPSQKLQESLSYV